MIRNRHHDYLNIIRFVLSIGETFIADNHAIVLQCNDCLFLYDDVRKDGQKMKKRRKRYGVYFAGSRVYTFD